MATRYRLSCVVDKHLVPTITALIIDRVHSYSVTELQEGDPGAKAPRGNGKYDDNRWMGKAAVAIMDHMKPGKIYSHGELGKLLPALSLKPSSISPILSMMAKHGKLKRVGRGNYKLPEEA